MTAVFEKFNTETGEAIFVNAGHESIMVFDKEKNFEFMKSEIPPIGIIKIFLRVYGNIKSNQFKKKKRF